MNTKIGFAPVARKVMITKTPPAPSPKPTAAAAPKVKAAPVSVVKKASAPIIKTAAPTTKTRPAPAPNPAAVRANAVALLSKIKAQAPKAWADIIARVGKPPSETGLGGTWDWLDSALKTAGSALDKYSEYKKNTATWKAELEALKAQTAATNATTAAQNSGSGSFFPTSTGTGTAAASTNYLPWIAGALGLGLLFTLRANPQSR
jgi:hypothetical protein